MNMKMTGLGAEPKKVIGLGALVLLGAYFYFSGSSGAPAGKPSSSSASSRPAAQAAPEPLKKMTARTLSKARGTQRSSGGGSFLEFRPSLKPRKDGEVDRASIDPTLRLDRLEKLRAIGFAGGMRSLFESSQGQAALVAIKEPPKIIVQRPVYGPPQLQKEVAAVKPPEPPPPPIALKFYGFISPRSSGTKRAFFLDGDDIIVASEGQLVKSRYRIVRIGVNSAVVEDTQFKNNQQTLPLVEEQIG